MTQTGQAVSLNVFVGARVRQVRTDLGLTLKDVVARMKESGGSKIDAAYLSRLERGLVRWSTNMIEQVAAAMETPPLYFMPLPGGKSCIELIEAWAKEGTAGVLEWGFHRLREFEKKSASEETGGAGGI